MSLFGGSGSSGSGDTGYDSRSNLGYGRPDESSSGPSSPYGSTTYNSSGDTVVMPNRVQNYGYEPRPSGPVGVADPYYPGAQPTFPTDPRYPTAGQQGYGQTPAVDGFSKDYKFSAEEMRVVKECTKESFWYRSLPLATAFAGLTHVAVQKGYLTASPKYGTIPKMAFASIFGFILGKMSYWKECQEKFLRLPDSRLADAIRRRQAGKTGQQFPAPSSFGQQRIYEAPYPASQGSGPISQRAGNLPGFPTTDKNEQSSAMNSTDDYHGALDVDSENSRYMLDIDDKPPSIFDFDSAREKSDRNAGGGSGSRTANYDDLRRQHRDTYLRPPQNSGQDAPPRRPNDF